MIRLALVLVAIVTAALPARADDLDDPIYACRKITERDKVTVSFQAGTRLDDLVTWYIGFTCATVVYSDAVACRTAGATIVAPEPITGAKARELFFDAIEVMGLRARVKGNKVVLTEATGKRATAAADCSSASTDPTVHAVPTVAPVADPAPVLDLTLIKKIDATHYEIQRTLVDAMLANPMSSLDGARAVPASKHGTPVGFKLSAVKAGKLWAVAGLRDGDTITAVAGRPLASVEAALDVFTELQTARTIAISLIRKGKPVTLQYVVK